MRTLLLTSSGLSPEISKELFALLPKKPEEAKVAFIATAADNSTDKGFVLKDRAIFESLGFGEIVEVDLKIPEDLVKLDDCDVIFVEGGNTYYLLKWVRQSGFDQKVKELLANDKIYIGASAGSMIMGTSIETAVLGHNKNEIGLEDLRGLRLVPFMIIAHVQDKDKIKMDMFARQKQLRPIIGLEDGQAIICEGDRYRIIGPGKVLTWHSKLFR